MALIHAPFITCLSYRIKKRKKGNDFQINQNYSNIHKNMLLLQKTGFLLNITDWIKVLNQRICHQTTDTDTDTEIILF